MEVHALRGRVFFYILDLGRIAASCLAHTSVDHVACTGQSTRSEGAEATRRACDKNNVIHTHSYFQSIILSHLLLISRHIT